MFQTIIIEAEKKSLFSAINNSHTEMADGGYEFVNLSSNNIDNQIIVFITYKKSVL